ncbi:MAG: hypothetical protein ACXVXP_05415 [Mycobacteriaceae bacterium]
MSRPVPARLFLASATALVVGTAAPAGAELIDRSHSHTVDD